MTCKNNNILLIVVLLSFMLLQMRKKSDLRTTTSRYLCRDNCTRAQQQRWKQPFQVEIDEYVQSSARRGHFGAGTITTVNGSSWEYPALSVESLARSLRNKTIYIDGDSHVYYFTVQLLYFLKYLCPNKCRVGKSTSQSRPFEPTAQCPEGEESYYAMHPDVAKVWRPKIAFDHWLRFGKREGRKYECNCDDVTSGGANISAILEHEQLYSGVKEHYKSLWGNGQIRFDNCFPLEEKDQTKDDGTGETASYVTVQHSFYYDQVDSGEESILSSATRAKPTTDIAILDFAVMHRLHLFPVKDDRWGTEKMIRNLGPSMRFEEQIERTVNSVADAGAKCIFLKTPNTMCSVKDPSMERNFVREFYGNLDELDRGVFDEDSCRKRMEAWRSDMPDSYKSSFGELSRLDMCDATRLQAKGSELTNACVETVQKQLLREGKDMEYGDTHSLCSYRFAQTNVGQESRRDQFQHFVSTNQERYWRERNVKLIYFDFYQIVKDHDSYCQHADDSNHYGKLLPLQVKLITNIIGQHCS